MRLSAPVSAALFAGLAAAHFKIDSPAQRDIDEEAELTFPCGGAPVSQNRTLVPMDLGPIQLDMEHDRVNLEVLIAIGNDPGSSFDTIILPTIVQEGIGKFCIGQVTIPMSLNITNGTNATIQVITGSESGSGGLYSCADITFSNASDVRPGECTNDTGVTTAAYTGPLNANGSGPTGTMTMGGGGSMSATGTAASMTSSAAATPLAVQAQALGALALGAIGAAALL